MNERSRAWAIRDPRATPELGIASGGFGGMPARTAGCGCGCGGPSSPGQRGGGGSCSCCGSSGTCGCCGCRSGGGPCGGKGGGPPNGGVTGPTSTPFLVIPASPSDSGARPLAPDPTVAFLNNSISATIANLPPSGPPSFGWGVFQMALSCVVANLGAVACPVGVAEFYVSPQLFVAAPGRTSLSPAQVQAGCRRIGYATFYVGPGGTTTVTCPKVWVPASSTDAQQGILVQVYDLFTDQLIAPFNAISDRHVARNDQVMDPIVE
jgi:hypothetical protein